MGLIPHLYFLFIYLDQQFLNYREFVEYFEYVNFTKFF